MAQKKKTNATVVSQEKLADGIYDLRLETAVSYTHLTLPTSAYV